MSGRTIVETLIGLGIGYFLTIPFYVFLAFRDSMWMRRAYRLAGQSSIALPAHLAERVARFLRAQYLFSVPALTAVIVVLDVVLYGDNTQQRDWTLWFPWLLAGMPVFYTPYFFTATLWPRWKASGARRVTHLRRMSVWEAFTPAEFAVVLIGPVFGVAFGAWGLWRVSAPAIWWVACQLGFGAAMLAWWYAAGHIMNRPSSASDELELGWDDLLRFRAVRDLTIGAAWLPPLMLLLVDDFMSWQLDKDHGFQLWPFPVIIVAALLLYRTLRQGRQLWRKAWLEQGGGR
jgi:hypothetical protein